MGMITASKQWKAVAAVMLLFTMNNISHAGENKMQAAEKLAIDKQGIKVWTFQTPNNPAFNYRASTEVDNSLSSVVALILDTGYLTKWVPYVSVVDVLDRDDNAGTFTIRMEMDFPFPLKDRDVVVKGKISQTPQGIVTIKNELATDKRAPINPKLVRITRYEGEWVLKPLAANKVSVMTTGYADPGGNVPLSIANMFTQKQPFEMLKNMKEEVKKANYQAAKLPFMKDPFATK
jgi:hypothetical protein